MQIKTTKLYQSALTRTAKIEKNDKTERGSGTTVSLMYPWGDEK